MKSRFIYRALKARYRDQRPEIKAALTALGTGDAAVDAGAHKGAYVYWLQKAVGPSGRVFAFEPQPRLAQYLRTVCARMKWRNVSISDCALSDAVGTGTLYVPGQGDSPGASLQEAVLQGEPGHSHPCAMDTLDHQLAGAGRVAFLKVDVEGHELRVFRGAARILSADAPVILFECEARHLHGHSMEDVFAYLKSFGYVGSFFCGRALLPLTAFSAAVHQKRDGARFWDLPGYCNNFLFRPGDGA
jgi:FkbM family methyltransferase